MIGVVSDESASLAIIIFPLKSILASIASKGFSPTFFGTRIVIYIFLSMMLYKYYYCTKVFEINRTITYRLTVHIKHHLIPENSKMNLVPFISEDLWNVPCHSLNAPIIFRNRKLNSFTPWVEPDRKLWCILTKKLKQIVNFRGIAILQTIW